MIEGARRRWSSPAWLAVGLALACGPRVGESGSGESVGQATDDPGETDDGATSAESGCPNDSEARTGYCFERVDLAFDLRVALAGDFLGDGLAQLGLFHDGPWTLTMFQWTGSMTPVMSTEPGVPGMFTMRGSADRDEMAAAFDSGLVRYRVVDGSIQTDTEAWPRRYIATEDVPPLVAIDADLDGFDEIISLDLLRRRDLELDYTPVVVVAHGSKGWTIAGDLPLRPHIVWGTTADLTGDGQRELVIGEQRSIAEIDDPYDPARDSVVVFRATPQGLVEIGRAPLGVQHWAITTGDVDGDGLLDILVSRDPNAVATKVEPHNVAVLRNLGDGVLEDPVLIDETHVTGDLVAADLDGDGRDELVYHTSTRTDAPEHSVVAHADPLGDSDVVTLVDGSVSNMIVADLDNDGANDLGFRTADGFHLLLMIR